MNHIELFAGCGGLSLGLESVGFELVMANELSPMAAETFAYNFFGQNLAGSKTSHSKTENKAVWLSSSYDYASMPSRLREDPRTYPELGEGYTDIEKPLDLKGNLVVGSIVELNKWLEKNDGVLSQLKTGFMPKGEVDLVSGGPPCQSFSMAGLRQLSNDRNILPWEFAKFVGMIKPKFALLENVTGILRAFNHNGTSFYAWFEVAKAFSAVGYIPVCLHINARFAGVAQNRPRFILIGIREDLYDVIINKSTNSEISILEKSKVFFDHISAGNNPEYGSLPCLDIVNKQDVNFFENSFLTPLLKKKSDFYSVKDAIDDLRSGSELKSSSYVDHINRVFGLKVEEKTVYNHELRRNGELVQRRFRIYQILSAISNDSRKEAKQVIAGKSCNLTDSAYEELVSYDYLIEVGQYKKFSNKSELIKYLSDHSTRKQTQKALVASQPAPAALSIPDDACHYHHDELRTLTVREMARIQSFPDSFVFRSKVTTGGQMRKFEVPQYTQVGNAVPPLLGRALGEVIINLLNKI